jgi:hypothetical protein
MKKGLYVILALVLALGLVIPLAGCGTDAGSEGSLDLDVRALADYDSPSAVNETGENTLTWSGQGATNGELNSVVCDEGLPEGVNPGDPYLLWVFTHKGDEEYVEMVTPYLVLDGSGSGTYYPTKVVGQNFHFVTPYYAPDSSTLTAVVHFNTLDTGNGNYVLTISHGCPGGGPGPEETLTVTKTVDTSYTRTHYWSIDKAVDTGNGYTEDGYPKVWLYVDGHGDETATWTVNATYAGYVDSDFNVAGEVTIENTGDLDAVITGVEDSLAGTPIEVHFPVDFPYTLVIGDTLTGTYSSDIGSKITGYNDVTVTTETAEYPADPIEITWGDPTTEVNKTVTIRDNSDLFGEVTLGIATAPSNGHFTYTKAFAWADYGADLCGDYTYDNTAYIVETGQSASAALTVNVQCYVDETAYAKGGGALCFIEEGFANWGWTNPITPGTYDWDLWAGAGQCDTSKGTLVGSVTVDYDGVYVDVTYNVDFPYLLKETHVYAGYTMLPQVKRGKEMVDTVAPGSYYNAGPFDGSAVYVIAHANVGIPDPNFGP